MRNPPFQMLVVGVLSALCTPAAAQGPEADPLACFCLHNPQEAYFLWGCKDATPRNAATKQAICWNRQTQTYSETPIRVDGPWVRIEDGEGSCAPCRPIREGAPDTPREGEECDCAAPASETSDPGSR